MAALSARRLVWPAMPVMVATMPPICSDFAPSWCIAAVTCAEDSRTWRMASVACADGLLALGGDLAGRGGRVGGLLGRLRGRAGGLADLLGRDLGLLDRAHLALGALGDVGHGGRDLADGAAGLLGGRRHLLRRGRQDAGVARDRADELGQALRATRCRRRSPRRAARGSRRRRDTSAELVGRGRRSICGVTGVTVWVRSPAAKARRPRVELGDALVAQRGDALERRPPTGRVTVRVMRNARAMPSSDGEDADDEDRALRRRRGRVGLGGARPSRSASNFSMTLLGAGVERLVGREDDVGVLGARAVALLDVRDGLLPRARRRPWRSRPGTGATFGLRAASIAATSSGWICFSSANALATSGQRSSISFWISSCAARSPSRT